MSVNDPIYPYFYERRGTWILVQGRETFYDNTTSLRDWETMDEAVEWGMKNLNPDLIKDKPKPLSAY